MANSRVVVIIGIAVALWWLVANQIGSPEDLNSPEAIVAAVRPGVSSSACRPTAAELAATEMAAGPAEGAATSTAVSYPVVTSELAVLAGDRDVPRLYPSLIVRAPSAAYPELAALLGASIAAVDPELKNGDSTLEEQNALRAELEEFLANAAEDPDDFGIFDSPRPPGGLFSGFRLLDEYPAVHPLDEVLAINEPPLVSLGEDGTFTLVVPKGPRVLADNRDISAGGWRVSTDGRYLHLRIKGRPPAQTAWQVRVCADGLEIVSGAMTSISTTPTPPNRARATPEASAATPGLATPVLATPGAVAATPALAAPAATPAAPEVAATPSYSKLLLQNSSIVSWWVRAAAEPPDLEFHVIVQASPLMQFRNWWFAGIRQTIHAVAADILPVTLLLLGLWLVWGRNGTEPELDEARDRLKAATWAAGRLSLAAVLTRILFFGPDQGFGPVPPGWVPTGVPLLVIISLGVFLLGFLDGPRDSRVTKRLSKLQLIWLIVSLFALGACFAVQRQIPEFLISSIVMPALLVAGYAMFLAAAVRERYGPWPIMVLPTIGWLSLLGCFMQNGVRGLAPTGELPWSFIAAAIIPLWVTFCAVVGFALFAAALVPEEIARLAPNRVRDLARPRSGRYAALLIVLAAVLLQWAWANYSQETVWWRALVGADPGSHFTEISQEVLIRRTDLPFYPVSFFRPLTGLFFFVGLIGTLGVMGAAARFKPSESGKLQVWGTSGRRTRIVLMVLFAVFVIGYGGEVLGFRTPVALLLGLVLLPLAWPDPDAAEHPGNNEADGDAASGTPNASAVGAEPAPVTEARAPVGTGITRSDSAEVDARHGQGPQGPADGAAGTKPEPMACPDREEVVRELAKGPSGDPKDWWKNGVLAVELGIQLAVLPIAYFIYVYFTSQGASGWTWSTPFAITGLISALIYEVAFWLVAAFVFGCLFVHLFGPNGLIRGAVLGAVYVAANAGAALFGIPGNVLWQVRSFQLLLFLMLLGALMDYRSMEAPRPSWRCLFEYYEIPFATNLFSKLLPLITALAAVVVQLLVGQTHEATVDLVSGEAFDAFSNLINSVGIGPPPGGG